jgi:hypothetical protein
MEEKPITINELQQDLLRAIKHAIHCRPIDGATAVVELIDAYTTLERFNKPEARK